MKDQIRILALDDAPFQVGDASTQLVGVFVRGRSYLEGVFVDEITVDGTDATEVIIKRILTSRFCEQVRVVMLDGIAFGGFNTVDITAIFEKTGIPVITVTRDKPDLEAIENALRGHFSDWAHRLDIITRHDLHSVETGHNPVWIATVGLDRTEADLIVRQNVVRGAIPEPIRVAHIIASGIKYGESRGKV